MEPGLLRAEGLDTISIEGVPLPLVDLGTAHPDAQGQGVSVIESGEFPVILSTERRLGSGVKPLQRKIV
jgi:hypothetical protein